MPELFAKAVDYFDLLAQWRCSARRKSATWRGPATASAFTAPSSTCSWRPKWRPVFTVIATDACTYRGGLVACAPRDVALLFTAMAAAHVTNCKDVVSALADVFSIVQGMTRKDLGDVLAVLYELGVNVDHQRTRVVRG